MFKVFAHKMIIERAAVSGRRQECYGMWIFGVIYIPFLHLVLSLASSTLHPFYGRLGGLHGNQ